MSEMILQMKSDAKQHYNNGYPIQTLSKETLKQLLVRLVSYMCFHMEVVLRAGIERATGYILGH